MIITDLQPGPDLDVLFLEKVYGFPRKKTFMTEYSTDPYYIPSGKPRRTHLIDARPVPRFSRDDATALAALERFAEKRGIGWTISRAPKEHAERYPGRRYYVTLHGDMMPMESQSAPTAAHAIVLAILAALPKETPK
jgi:hypothetical protein